MDLTVKMYLDNWDNYWQSYLILNPDLAMAGINDKRKAKNHYQKCGINEHRQVVKIVSEPVVLSTSLFTNDNSITNEQINNNTMTNNTINSVTVKEPAIIDVKNSFLLSDMLFKI